MNWYKKAQQNKEEIVKNLTGRGVDPNRTLVYIDHNSNMATFPIFTVDGKLIGYQRYNPSGDKKIHNDPKNSRYYTYIGSDAHKANAMWGVETIDKRPFLFLTEGIFDAIKLHNMGLPAVAVLTATLSGSMKNQLKLLGKRLISILDNDQAGQKIKHFANESYTVPNPYKDLGEMPQEEVEKFIRTIKL